MFCLSMISQLPHGWKFLNILPVGWIVQSRGLQDKALEGISSVTASISIFNKSLVSTLIENSDCKFCFAIFFRFLFPSCVSVNLHYNEESIDKEVEV